MSDTTYDTTYDKMSDTTYDTSYYRPWLNRSFRRCVKNGEDDPPLTALQLPENDGEALAAGFFETKRIADSNLKKIDNELFSRPNAMMLFGDARRTLAALVRIKGATRTRGWGLRPGAGMPLLPRREEHAAIRRGRGTSSRAWSPACPSRNGTAHWLGRHAARPTRRRCRPRV